MRLLKKYIVIIEKVPFTNVSIYKNLKIIIKK